MCVCVIVVVLLNFLLLSAFPVFFCSFFLQYFDTVGWIFWPVKLSSR